MKKHTFKIGSYDRDILESLIAILAPGEELRLRFYGTLSKITSLCQVSLFIPKGLKVAKKKAHLTDYKGEELLLEHEVKKLPGFEKQLNDMGHLIVDFECPVLSVDGSKVQVLLPDSYKSTDKIKPSVEDKPRTFTFKTEHSYLSRLISTVLDCKPIVQFYGPLSMDRPEESKVTISLPVKFETMTMGGGRVSLSTQGIELAVVDDIPGWQEKAEELGCKGYIFTNFEAVILKAVGDEITVSLPSSYR